MTEVSFNHLSPEKLRPLWEKLEKQFQPGESVWDPETNRRKSMAGGD